MSDTTGMNYFQHLPGSAYARSGEPAAPAAQPVAPVSDGPPQGTPTGSEVQYTPEQIQQFIRTAEAATNRASELERRNQFYENQNAQWRQVQAEQEWEQRRQQVLQEAAGMNFDDALQHVMNFDRAATQALTTESKNMFMNFATGMYADKLIADYGLKPEDRMFLGNDTNTMELAAKRIADDRKSTADEIAKIRGEVEQYSGQQYVAERIAAGAHTGGGPGGRQPVVDPSSLSEIDQLRDALRG